MYVSHFLIFVGCAILTQSLLFGIVRVFQGCAHWIIVAEERWCIERFGETFLQFEAPEYSVEGVQSFRDFIENKEMIQTLEFWGAYDNNELKGVIATNENRKHICCFFVKAEYHRQGIGKKLWEYLRDNSQNEILGFTDTDIEQLTDGIRYTPMKFEKCARFLESNNHVRR